MESYHCALTLLLLVQTFEVGFSVNGTNMTTTVSSPPPPGRDIVPAGDSHATMSIRYIIVAVGGGLVALSLVMVATVSFLACYFIVVYLNKKMHRSRERQPPVSGCLNEVDGLGFRNPVYGQESEQAGPGRLVPSLPRRASASTTVVTIHHAQETGVVGYDQSEQLPPDPATKKFEL